MQTWWWELTNHFHLESFTAGFVLFYFLALFLQEIDADYRFGQYVKARREVDGAPRRW